MYVCMYVCIIRIIKDSDLQIQNYKSELQPKLKLHKFTMEN